MNKGFEESLRDGFTHVVEITNPEFLKQLRQDGVKVDTHGYWSFLFGEHKEYELRIEPIGEEHQYLVALYKGNVLLTEKLPLWSTNEEQ